MIKVLWDLEDDPRGNVIHIAEHDVTPEEVEEVLNDRQSHTVYSTQAAGRLHLDGLRRGVILP